jgi:L-threonylcarbamoyladenylate synthase
MKTLRLQSDLPADRARAAALLRDGRLVAFPTETVYGLGARGDCTAAMDRLYEVKGRVPEKKCTILVASVEAAGEYAAFDAAAEALAQEFWPGPLTLVLPDGRGGDVGLRCPDHADTRAMLGLVGAPVAVPSANPAGEPPATCAAQVLGYFDGRIAAVLDGGASQIGTASCVARISAAGLEVLRSSDALPETELRRVWEATQGASD